ncbi:1-deoxy-D-xylulose-5-phosphate reductoisomerase [Hippea alviniae]|uniref:1-deoxy-D-xylulose-5-phosphate reductoisomerase n=1 Tax=Hippea alviniae TaxID=1279027 RepID=UPI0003B3BFFE|nr:1-deoxy-D-xylulose-5-phosphate reductoisomerase [Hippea alviniae]
MQNLLVLGSTGSIGRNTLDIVSRTKEFNVVGLSCKSNIDELSRQIEKFKPKYVCVEDSNLAAVVRERFKDITVFEKEEGLIELVSLESVDFVVNAIVGSAGLSPTYYTLKNSKKLALANKESLVVAGRLLKKIANDNGIEIVPIDSEHSAIYQCLEGKKKEEIEKLILTASGGPFLDKDFTSATVEDALSHPNWDMGKKITIDSATMMNKGFEIIEARWLFDIKSIEVVIHPESIIHSAVEFVDGSIIAQIADHDMRIPIAYALFKPKRVSLPFKISLSDVGKLTFRKPEFGRFPTLEFAFEALRKEEKNLGLILNVADEIAVESFLKEKIKFVDIFRILEISLEKFEDNLPSEIDGIKEMLRDIKVKVLELLKDRFWRS